MYLDKDINAAISKMQPDHLQDELKEEIFLVVCEMPEEKLFHLYENSFLKFFIVRTMLNMAKSDRSNFFTKFRKTLVEYIDHYDPQDITEDHETTETILMKSMNELHWYERTLFEEYATNGQNILQLSVDTQIPYRSLSLTLSKVKGKLSHALKKPNMSQHKLIGNTVHARLDVYIDINKPTDMDDMLDILDEVNAFIKEKIEGRMKDDVVVKKVGGLLINKVI